MKATFLYGANDVRVENVNKPAILKQTDAVIRTVLACVCGSDLWDYYSKEPSSQGVAKGHEVIGVVEEIGTGVNKIKVGDLVVVPFVASCGTCDFCLAKQFTSCRQIEFFGHDGGGACQAEFVRIPWADGTMVKLPVDEKSSLLPSLLTLSDVLCTGYHAAVSANVKPGDTVAVVGDGAVGLSAVIGAKKLGADRIILVSSHASRAKLGVEFGATHVVTQRGDEGIARVKELTGGDGVMKVLEAVGTQDAIDFSIAVTRDYGTVGRVGAAQYETVPLGFGTIMRNITVSGGVAPARAYVEELMADIISGKINPGKVFDLEVSIDNIADGYKAMADRKAIKTLVRF
jgi:threonine dehydrogenase-like Zn-dependent dehydrogenase